MPKQSGSSPAASTKQRRTSRSSNLSLGSPKDKAATKMPHSAASGSAANNPYVSYSMTPHQISRSPAVRPALGEAAPSTTKLPALDDFFSHSYPKIMQNDLAWPFVYPVDDVAIGIPDYYTVFLKTY